MTYRQEDWEELLARLEAAEEFLRRAQADDQQKHLLAPAVWSLWSFGEYAVNVVLELEGKDIDRHHRQAELAQALFLGQVLKRDYFERLEQLESYRRKATHKGYAKKRTVHYSTRNVADCLEAMQALAAEVHQVLRERGRLEP